MRRKFRSLFMFLLSALLVISLLLFAADIANGIRQGLNIALNTIIPSLFSFIVLSSFLLKSGLADYLILPLKRPIAVLFGVAPRHAAIVFMSLIGGYPVGASLIAQSLREKRMTKKQAERLICFCVNSGPAFLIGTIGIPLFGDARFGLILFGSHLLSALLIANLTRHSKQDATADDTTTCVPISQALIDATHSGCKSMLTICALILVFSAVTSILDRLHILTAISKLFSIVLPIESARVMLNGILEICRGCTLLQQLHGIQKLLFASGLTAFAGLCVHMQISAILTPLGISLKRFFGMRIIYTVSSILFTYLIVILSRIAIPTIAIQTSSVGGTAYAHLSSVFLLLLCILLLLNGEKSVMMKKRHQTNGGEAHGKA